MTRRRRAAIASPVTAVYHMFRLAMCITELFDLGRMARFSVVSLLIVGVLSACAPAADPTWERLRQTRTLRVGMDASFPPFESIASDGSLEGFDVDLAREVSRRLGLEPRFVANLPYDGLYDALTAERVDVVISALAVDPSRMDDFAYSRVYFDAGHVLVARAGTQGVDSMTDLAGRRLAVVLGTEGDREGRRWARRLTDLDLVQYRTPIQALSGLRGGETDVALVDHVSALRAVGQEGDLVVVGESVVEVPYACAVRRESFRLLEALNGALAAMEDDGTKAALIAKWLR